MATLTVYPNADPESSSVDGYLSKQDTSWSGVRNAAEAGNASDSFAYIYTRTQKVSDTNWIIIRSILLFDTSDLLSGDTINSAILSINPLGTTNEDSDSVVVVSSSPASDTSLAVGDYDSLGSANFSEKAISSINTNVYNDFSLNASGLAVIDKDGVTKYGLLNLTDFGNSPPVGDNRVVIKSADQAGTTVDPKLVIDYSPVEGRSLASSRSVASSRTLASSRNLASSRTLTS